MSFEAEFELHQMPSRGDIERIAAEVCGLAQLRPAVVKDVGDRAVDVVFTVEVNNAEHVPGRLSEHTMELEDIRQDLDPPRGEIDHAACVAAGLVSVSGPITTYLP